MPNAKTPDERSHTNIQLVKKYVADKFTLEVAEIEHVARVREAVEKKSIVSVLQKEIEAAEVAAQAKKQKAKETLNTELERLRVERDAGRMTVAEYQRAREQANDLYIASCDKAETSLARKKKSLNDQLTAQRLEDERTIQQIAAAYAEQQYNKLSVYARAELQTKKANIAAEERAQAQAEAAALAETVARLEAERNTGKRTKAELKLYDEQIAKVKEDQAEATQTILAAEAAEISAKQEAAHLEEVILNAKLKQLEASNVRAQDLLDEVSAAIDSKKEEISDLHVQIEANQQLGIDSSDLEARLAELTDEVGAVDVPGSLENLKATLTEKAHKEKVSEIKNSSVQDAAKEIERGRDIEKAENDKSAKAQWAYFLSPQGMKDNLGKAVANAVENVAAQISQALNQIDDNINQFYQYQSSVEARLQGSDESYKKSLRNISRNVGISGLVSQKEVIENLKKLSEAGIAYNLDLRAFLATIKDDIAETFDVFDSNLMRLIRLQQSDTTAARLGMEASLTRLFNEYFSDTSYLTDAADTVSQAIIDANSQLTKNMSIEFEYMVQKWLGALYSLGMDSGTISTIAQGLNFLGTGNVEALNGNESLQSLLAMSASRAGISYADILTGGLDAETTNNLMKSMIEYLKSIAENTDNNQVTKSAYSNVFGFSISDLTAVSSLSEADIKNIHKESLNYQGAMDEYAYQANQIFSRTHFSQMINTVFDNAMMSASTAIGNTVYPLWKVLNVVEDLTGGIAIPGISVMGNMVDLHQTVVGLAKTGIAGLGLMGSLLGSLFNGSLFGTMEVNKWGYDEFTSRGSGTKGISKGTAQGTSESTSMNMVGSSSSDDIKSTSMNDATDDAEEDSKVTNKNVKENADIYTKIYEAIASEDTTILQEVITLQTVLSDLIGTTNQLLREDRRFKSEISGMDSMLKMLDPNRVFYSMIVGMLPLTNESFTVDESKMLAVTEAAITTAFAATAHNVTKETTAAIQEITSVATELQADNYSNFTTQPVVTPNITVEVTNTVPEVKVDVPKDDKPPAESPLDTTFAVPDISQLGKDTTTAITRLESAITSVDTQNIANLMAQTSVGMHESNDKTTNQLITNDGLKVSINQMSPEVSAYIAATVKAMVASALTGGISETNSDGETVSLMSLLTTLLQSNTLNVNVTNDNFDTALQKSAFTT